MLSKPLVFVDIETTADRIIEIALIRLENGREVARFESLVDPEIPISAFSENLTGISSYELKNAPLFPLVFKECKHLFDDAIFIAHNVAFDYNVIKGELSRIGYNFSLPRACTVKLSRKLYPQYRSHSLESLIQRHGIEVSSRHRAMADVEATLAWWNIAHQEHSKEIIFTHIASQLKKQTSLNQIDSSQISSLPKTSGVYIFYNSNQVPLYVGKSINIYDRVVSHLSSGHLNKTDFKLCQTATSIKTIPTAGELSALLLESQLVKELQPLYNRRLRQKKKLLVAIQEEKNNYKTTKLITTTSLDFNQKIMGVFTSKRDYHNQLHKLATKHKLCKHLLGLDQSSPCFGRQLSQCKGACESLENSVIYNLRFDMAFLSLRLKPWPFSGAKIVEEYNPEFDLYQKLTIDNWVIENSDPNLDTYKILASYLVKI